MTDQIISSSQIKAAKLAAILFLFFVVTSISHYTIIELHLIIPENTQAIATFVKNIQLSSVLAMFFQIAVGFWLLFKGIKLQTE